MLRRIAVILFVALVAAGCGDSSPTAPSGPVYPNIEGRYASNTMFFNELTQPSTGGKVSASCNGSITVSQQNNQRFSGSWIIEGCTTDPNAVRSGTLSGTVNLDGGISYTMQSGSGGDNLDALLASLGCAPVGSDAAYSGRVSGRNWNAQGTATLFCVDFGTLTYVERHNGNR